MEKPNLERENCTGIVRFVNRSENRKINNYINLSV